MNAIRIALQDHELTNEAVMDIHKPEDVRIRWDIVDGESGAVVREGDGGYTTPEAAVEAAREYAKREGLMDS